MLPFGHDSLNFFSFSFLLLSLSERLMARPSQFSARRLPHRLTNPLSFSTPFKLISLCTEWIFPSPFLQTPKCYPLSYLVSPPTTRESLNNFSSDLLCTANGLAADNSVLRFCIVPHTPPNYSGDPGFSRFSCY